MLELSICSNNSNQSLKLAFVRARILFASTITPRLNINPRWCWINFETQPRDSFFTFDKL